jgi:hypothetical protein
MFRISFGMIYKKQQVVRSSGETDVNQEHRLNIYRNFFLAEFQMLIIVSRDCLIVLPVST